MIYFPALCPIVLKRPIYHKKSYEIDKNKQNIIDYIKNKSWQKKNSNYRLKGLTQRCLEKKIILRQKLKTKMRPKGMTYQNLLLTLRLCLINNFPSSSTKFAVHLHLYVSDIYCK